MLALFLTGFGKSLIYQYGFFGFLLSGFDPVPRQDSALLVVSLLSAVMSEKRGAIHVNVPLAKAKRLKNTFKFIYSNCN